MVLQKRIHSSKYCFIFVPHKNVYLIVYVPSKNKIDLSEPFCWDTMCIVCMREMIDNTIIKFNSKSKLYVFFNQGQKICFLWKKNMIPYYVLEVFFAADKTYDYEVCLDKKTRTIYIFTSFFSRSIITKLTPLIYFTTEVVTMPFI